MLKAAKLMARMLIQMEAFLEGNMIITHPDHLRSYICYMQKTILHITINHILSPLDEFSPLYLDSSAPWNALKPTHLLKKLLPWLFSQCGNFKAVIRTIRLLRL